MDQFEFSRRLRVLAGPQNHDAIGSGDDYMLILGSLGLACTVRRVQAAILVLMLCAGSLVTLNEVALMTGVSNWGVALLQSGVSLFIVRHFPYWTPAGALRDGLTTLSRFRLNNLGEFLAHQRTDLTVVNNKLLSDLCVQLTMDRRRPRISAAVTFGGVE